MELDEIDRKILHVLSKSADIPNNALADQVGLTPGPCLRRVQRLREEGIIQRYTVALDAAALGYSVSAFVEISLERHSGDISKNFLKAIQGVPQVLSCFMVAGDCDYILRVAVKSLSEYQRLIWNDLHAITGIRTVRSIIVLDTMKDVLNPLP
jgi:Lrp/AsnC family transcriptional regulator, leucine-responsive regulatory protein